MPLSPFKNNPAFPSFMSGEFWLQNWCVASSTAESHLLSGGVGRFPQVERSQEFEWRKVSLVAWASDLSLVHFHSERILVPGETEEALFQSLWLLPFE